MLKVSAHDCHQMYRTCSSFEAFNQQTAHLMRATLCAIYRVGQAQQPCTKGIILNRLMSAGDQEDAALLNEIKEDALAFSGYDIIVDDGGHKSSQMLASFRVSCAPA